MSASTAGVEDNVPELIRLRLLLFETLDGEFFNPSSPDNSWRHILGAVLKESLTADAMRILVVVGDDGLAACAIGTIAQHPLRCRHWTLI
jgi:hypothetical protein